MLFILGDNVTNVTPTEKTPEPSKCSFCHHRCNNYRTAGTYFHNRSAFGTNKTTVPRLEAVSYYQIFTNAKKSETTRMWANAQRDGRPTEHRWRRLFNAAKFD